MGGLCDRFGRRVRRLRLSVTDRCNFQCRYCLPSRPCWTPRTEILRRDEIVRLARIALGLGIDRLRLTGGEPLLREDIVEVTRDLAALPGLADLSLTTNASLLEPLARPLREAGLRRVNVSLDSLKPEAFARITGRAGLDRVLAGLAAAERAGLTPIKVNAVILRGENDGEIEDFGRFARQTGYQVRFIEYMPLDNGGRWSREQVVTGDEILARMGAVGPLVPDPADDPADPARTWRFADGRGGIGLISAVSRRFCQRCDRLRITADGKVRACLFAKSEASLMDLLRGGAADEALAARLRRTVAVKDEGHRIGCEDFHPPPRRMSAVGG